ncbi:hypothetical protein [Salipiger bermudensis]|uniref:hypothetical protein n=1 Tax=Salipiger TaxID=263377 RepID=UPI001CD617C0|nr:hypothetical protein [Salipiger bermudensis]MBR9892043.1 hypothetical protein [bacterium]MCA1288084.1 hypothetical protein [Salipiger bermudensis]
MNAIQKRARVQSFLAQYDLDLQHACLLIGGPPALQRLQRFRRALAIAERLSSSHRRELAWLKRLLANDFLPDLGFEEDAFHAEVDPSDPAIYTLCELVEAIDALITELGQPGQSAAVSKRNAA